MSHDLRRLFMRMTAILPAWGRILRGYRPFLSIEITRECPLRCPGCYAYHPSHLGNGGAMRDLTDLRGDELEKKVLATVRKLRPLHLSIVGGEPLVRQRELTRLIPRLNSMGIEVQVVTSATSPIPVEWASFKDLHLVVSIDGLQPDHDVRRSPATYERIIRNTQGHRVIVHWTITRQSLLREGCIEEFARFWSGKESVSKIWFSFFTPQVGEYPPERLNRAERLAAIERIAALPAGYPKVYAPSAVLSGYRNPPRAPSECIFAQTTTCISADLTTQVTPCQVGGRPDCSECGCLAAVGLTSIGKFKLAGLLRVSDLFAASRALGEGLRRASGRCV
jgi:pyruvate-formate lyase-activating enzyme